jgi:predicted nucleic acid-binding protein
MIVAAAAVAGSDVLWTEDLRHGAIIEGVRVSNPFLPPP